MLAQGTTPSGAESEKQASTWVREMFSRIAPRYDLLNHLLSLNIDRMWRARTVSRVSEVLARPEAQVLDVACGTGDLTVALASHLKSGAVFGTDFCHPMLQSAHSKLPSRRMFEADALSLPVADAVFDLVTIAFGFRNLVNYTAGFAELRRVLKPGGMLAILEFSTPPNHMLRTVYQFYSRALLPAIGGIVSGSHDAYTYLPESVRKFPDADRLADQMREAGFSRVRFERMTAGIVALHLGHRS